MATTMHTVYVIRFFFSGHHCMIYGAYSTYDAAVERLQAVFSEEHSCLSDIWREGKGWGKQKGSRWDIVPLEVDEGAELDSNHLYDKEGKKVW